MILEASIETNFLSALYDYDKLNLSDKTFFYLSFIKLNITYDNNQFNYYYFAFLN